MQRSCARPTSPAVSSFIFYEGKAFPKWRGNLIVGSLTLYAIRAPSLQTDGGFAPVSRESFLLLNNALLVAAAGLILLCAGALSFFGMVYALTH